MIDIEQDILARLAHMGVVPLLGGLVPEPATAELLGYAPSYLRRLAAAGLSPLPFILRGNRRFYKVDDIRLFVTRTVA
ncbi:DNA-binding protein [Pseudomonas oryzihabitans]|uniref:DNA-binding protein n=1 Tax=Pseudomonas oryzihabitans TaxID=47885 RepID=UPI0021B59569|nr:DNA-binding protein [Pseudomonas oryzihabitans]